MISQMRRTEILTKMMGKVKFIQSSDEKHMEHTSSIRTNNRKTVVYIVSISEQLHLQFLSVPFSENQEKR